MMSDTSLKNVPSGKVLHRALLVGSGVVACLGGAPGANAANCITGVPSFQLELFASGAAPREHLPDDARRACQSLSGPGSVSISQGIVSVGSLGTVAQAIGTIPPTPTRASKMISPSFSPALASRRWSSHLP
jgi:hypothetical protein